MQATRDDRPREDLPEGIGLLKMVDGGHVHVRQTEQRMALGLQAIKEVHCPWDGDQRRWHLPQKCGDVGFRQAGTLRGTHNGVLPRERAAIKREPIGMPEDLRAHPRLDHRIVEDFGDDDLWLPRHNDPAEIKYDVQDDFSQEHQTVEDNQRARWILS